MRRICQTYPSGHSRLWRSTPRSGQGSRLSTRSQFLEIFQEITSFQNLCRSFGTIAPTFPLTSLSQGRPRRDSLDATQFLDSNRNTQLTASLAMLTASERSISEGAHRYR